ncbi:MAG TPA: glycosyltransferase family 2 protein [Candidatus Saccharimonadales bacterium]|jgi:cellulose synthase/poly-beta-1,6-N-acetylglucosamine synthase-like glycosyltransferase|nr:glycosyltransferase family 2 protein [Candidatus Saccharimonadales bacterium]
MKKTLIEIPYPNDRGFRYRLFEILPGALSYLFLATPLILTLINPYYAVFFVLAFLLLWFTKAAGMGLRSIQGYRRIKQHQKLPWEVMLTDVTTLKPVNKVLPKWHYDNLKRISGIKNRVLPDEIYQAVIIAVHNESRGVIEPTIKSILNSNYDMKRIILTIAFEERGGVDTEKLCIELVKEYGPMFKHAFVVKHPNNTSGEVKGKGPNITFAGYRLEEYIKEQKINPKNVLVTTLDSDNRPHPEYFSSVSYLYCSCEEPKYVSFQPVPMYTNNIWDAPAPMRVIATGSSFWMTVSSLRPHALRNFSAHSQSLEALIDTNFWSTRTIVEDGHQFWRTYFRYDGNHEVFPVYVPIYQDAVLSSSYLKTLKSQFTQLKRWAWGASDIAYVIDKGFFTKNKVPKKDLSFKLFQLIEGHVSWATAAFLLLYSAFIPALLHPQNLAASQLPIVVRDMQDIALSGILLTLLFGLRILPPKPPHYKNRHRLFMVIQWVYLPFTTIIYNATAGIYSQTRLMFGRYMDVFDATEKAVVTSVGNKKVKS